MPIRRQNDCGFIMKGWIIALLLASSEAAADPVGVLELTSDRPIDEVYSGLCQALEDRKFWVVFESDMGQRMAKFADRWGEDYNRNGLESVRSLVFCNVWWTNRIANADPDLLGLCPLHLSLCAKDGKTVVLLPRLSAMAEGSSGKEAAWELEAELRKMVESALAAD
jgi:uncharacterized protein (DUF302 family)